MCLEVFGLVDAFMGFRLRIALPRWVENANKLWGREMRSPRWLVCEDLRTLLQEDLPLATGRGGISAGLRLTDLVVGFHHHLGALLQGLEVPVGSLVER